MFLVLRFFLCALLAAKVFAADSGQLDASPALFSVMAALHAAGYDAELDSPNNHPLRLAVRKHLAAQTIGVVPEIKAFLDRRGHGPGKLDLSRFISFALSTNGPPDFHYRFEPHEMPPDVIPLEGFELLMTRFYREAHIEELWQQAQPAIEKALLAYQEPVIHTLSQVNGYLRNPTSGYMGRKFQIYLELLGPPNQIQTRSYKDDYYLVITPSPEPQVNYIRYAYLNFLLDPLSIKYTAKLDKKKALLDFAQPAPALESYYKSEFQLLVTASLIKAIESRLDKSPAEAEEAFREGFILTPYFAERLPVYEKQEAAMRLYYPEMIDAIDLRKEDKRLEKVQFVEAKPARVIKVVTVAKRPELTGVFKILDEAEELYRSRKLEAARPLYLRALEETQEKPLHAKAYYGLARIAILERNPELGEKLLQKVLELTPDAQTQAWSLVYLGRLEDAAGEREQAIIQYQAALAVTGGSEAARAAAKKALEAPAPNNGNKEK